MTITHFTYQHLVDLVEGDREVIVHLVEEGIIEVHDDLATFDPELVQVARTLWRELEIDWPGIAVILRLRGELAAARHRIDELEAELARDRGRE
jgi:hypothetical protein